MKKIKKVTRRLSLALALVLAFCNLAMPIQVKAAAPPQQYQTTRNRTPVLSDIEVYNLTDATYVKHDPLRANKSYEIVYLIEVDERVKGLEFYAAQVPQYLYRGQDLTLDLETYATLGKTRYSRAKEVTLYSEENLWLRTSATVRTDIQRYNWYEPQVWDEGTRTYRSYYNFYKSNTTPAGRYYEVHIRIDAFKV